MAGIYANGIIPFDQRVSRGSISGWTVWNKFGYNTGMVNGQDNVIAEFGGVFQYQTTGQACEIVWASANDVNGGTGCHGVVVYGVGDDWTEQIRVYLSSGGTQALPDNWIGINRMSAFRCGSGRKNDGLITLRLAGGGAILAETPAGQGTTQQCVFYVPANCQFDAKWLWFKGVKSSGGGNPTIEMFGRVYSAVSNSEYEVYRDVIVTQDDPISELAPGEPFVIGEKSVLWFYGDPSGNNTEVKGRFSGTLGPLTL